MLDGDEVGGGIEMMSGAGWVRDRLATVGWDVRLADARKVKSIAPLAWKTDPTGLSSPQLRRRA